MLSLFLFAAAASAAPTTTITKQSSPPAIPIQWEYSPNLPKINANLVWGTGANGTTNTVMDLGSSAFWVYGPNNTISYGSQFHEAGPCTETFPYFDWASSTTHEGPSPMTLHEYAYGGNAHVVYAYESIRDTLGFANTKYPALQNQTVALSNYTVLSGFAVPDCSGESSDYSILGLFPNGTPSFRDDLLSSGQVEASVMSMWFDQAPGEANGTFEGTLLFGALPPKSKYQGDLVQMSTYVSGKAYVVPKPTIKAAPLSDATDLQTLTPIDDTVSCMLDSGSPNLELPFGSQQLQNITNLTTYEDLLAFNGSCDSIPRDAKLDFEFVGVDNNTVTVSLPLRNLARGYYSTITPADICVLSVFLDETGTCVLGAPFFSSALVVINDAKQEIGLAQGGVSQGAVDGLGDLDQYRVIKANESLFA